MRVTISAATLLAWVSAALAQTAGFDAISLPAQDESVPAGSTYTVKWDYSATYAGTVSIQLLQGADPTTLQLGPVVASMSSSYPVNAILSNPVTHIIFTRRPRQQRRFLRLGRRLHPRS